MPRVGYRHISSTQNKLYSDMFLWRTSENTLGGGHRLLGGPEYRQVGGELKSFVANVASARSKAAAQQQAQEMGVERQGLQC